MEKKISSLGNVLSRTEQKKVQGGFDNCHYYSAGAYSRCMSFAGSTHEVCSEYANFAYNRCREGFPEEELPQ